MPDKKAKPPISVTHPELAKEADGWDPSVVTAGSNQKLAWCCSSGHKWSAVVASRTSGTGCPACSGRTVIEGVNDLLTTHPQLASQAFGWDPRSVKAGSAKKNAWKCEHGHVWTAIISSRASGMGCPVCSGRATVRGFNDLKTIAPQIAAQAFGWNPDTYIPKSHEQMNWVCELKHEWRASLQNRKRGTGCPVCANQIVLKGFNDLATTNPTLASEANGWDPTEIIGGTHKKLEWKCKFGHTWVAEVKSRVSGNGCPTCSGRRILIGFNDLASTEPEIASQAFGWDPRTVTRSSGDPQSWRCNSGHTWKSSTSNRTSGKGCPFCSNVLVLPGFNDLLTTHPAIAAQAQGWDPSQVIGGSAKKLLWHCDEGHNWLMSPIKRTDRSQGCNICSGHVIAKGFNDLASLYPQLAKEADGWDPTSTTVGKDGKRKWICDQGHKWSAEVNARVHGIGCPSCASHGFDPNAQGWLYFLTHRNWEMLQIGISNVPEQRLKSHKKLGWEVIEIRGPMDGLIAREWETSILQMLKRGGAKLAVEGIAGKFDGYSEAWLAQTFPATSLRELMDLVIKDEEDS